MPLTAEKERGAQPTSKPITLLILVLKRSVHATSPSSMQGSEEVIKARASNEQKRAEPHHTEQCMAGDSHT